MKERLFQFVPGLTEPNLHTFFSASYSICSSAHTKWAAILTGWCTCGKMNVQKYVSQQKEKWLFVEISQITDEMAAAQ